MLDAHREQAGGHFLDLLTVIIEIADAAFGGPLNLLEHLRHREAALLIGGGVLGQGHDFRVYEIARLRLLVLAGDIHDDHAQWHADLDRGEPDAGCGIHCFQHVIHELADLVAHPAFDGFGSFLQTRVRDGENVSDGHRLKIGSRRAAVNSAYSAASLASSSSKRRSRLRSGRRSGSETPSRVATGFAPAWAICSASNFRAFGRTLASSEPTKLL